MFEGYNCENCGKPSDNPLCCDCLNNLFEQYDKDQIYNTKEYEVVVKATISSTLDTNQLERQLVLALWEGMDESVVIPDGQTDQLRVIEYTKTTAMEEGNESFNPQPIFGFETEEEKKCQVAKTGKQSDSAQNV